MPAPPPLTQAALVALANSTAQQYGLNAVHFTRVISCESGFSATTVGDEGTSYGIAQIHLPAHPGISQTQALDPTWSITWMAQQWSAGNQGMWSCWRILYGGDN